MQNHREILGKRTYSEGFQGKEYHDLNWTDTIHDHLQHAESYEHGNEPSIFTESATSLVYPVAYIQHETKSAISLSPHNFY